MDANKLIGTVQFKGRHLPSETILLKKMSFRTDLTKFIIIEHLMILQGN